MDASFLRGVVAYDSHADGVKFQMLFMHQFVTSPALSTAGCLHKGHGPILCSRRHLSSIRHQTIRTSQLSSRFGNSPLKWHHWVEITFFLCVFPLINTRFTTPGFLSLASHMESCSQASGKCNDLSGEASSRSAGSMFTKWTRRSLLDAVEVILMVFNALKEGVCGSCPWVCVCVRPLMDWLNDDSCMGRVDQGCPDTTFSLSILYGTALNIGRYVPISIGYRHAIRLGQPQYSLWSSLGFIN